MNGYQIEVPLSDNEFAIRLKGILSLNSEFVVLNVEPGITDEVCGCFDNVQKRVESHGGELILGWQFWKHPYMIEAEFHAVWRNQNNELLDITPKDDPAITKILFVEDTERKYNGLQIDNVRINTTDNDIIDDLIEAEKAKYRFLNKDGRDKIIGELILQGIDIQIWQSINKFSAMCEYLYFSGGDAKSLCFCNSGISYHDCHRTIMQRAMNEI